MKDILIDDFQDHVAKSLIRHKSILDIMTKSSESNSRVNRAVAKSISRCGCIGISAHKQRIPEDASLDDLSNILSTQIDGELCSSCREVLKSEIGANIYYITALCDALDLDLSDIISEQHEKLKTLGKYTML